MNQQLEDQAFPKAHRNNISIEMSERHKKASLRVSLELHESTQSTHLCPHISCMIICLLNSAIYDK